MAFLEALNAPDLGLLVNGEDFAATQEMTEEMRQEVSFQGAFGTDGPVLRQVRQADEGTVSFSAILLRSGVARGLNDETRLRSFRDFEIITRRGNIRQVYRNCNWTRIAVRSTLDQVTIDCDASVPGWVR
jgi:hypothetical protein